MKGSYDAAHRRYLAELIAVKGIDYVAEVFDLSGYERGVIIKDSGPLAAPAAAPVRNIKSYAIKR